MTLLPPSQTMAAIPSEEMAIRVGIRDATNWFTDVA